MHTHTHSLTHIHSAGRCSRATGAAVGSALGPARPRRRHAVRWPLLSSVNQQGTMMHNETSPYQRCTDESSRSAVRLSLGLARHIPLELQRRLCVTCARPPPPPPCPIVTSAPAFSVALSFTTTHAFAQRASCCHKTEHPRASQKPRRSLRVNTVINACLISACGCGCS